MKELLPLFTNPSHYLGSEYNAVHKFKQQIKVHWGLAFPDLYNVGMSYQGLQILYQILNQESKIWAERIFAPHPQVGNLLKKHGYALSTLESDTKINELDLVGFSLTHELCFTTVLYILNLSGIPAYAKQRKGNSPLLLAGGGACFNPEPFAEFFDLIVLGDGETVCLEISQIIMTSKAQGWNKNQVLKELSYLSGVYVPNCKIITNKTRVNKATPIIPGVQRASKEKERNLYVEKRLLTDLNQFSFLDKPVIPFGKPIHDRLTLEISRGCSRGCRFCLAGMTYRPVREKSLTSLDTSLKQLLQQTGYEEVSFLSLSTGDFSALKQLFSQSLSKCLQEQVSISLPSLRAGSISYNLLQQVSLLRRTGITLAPEAGSQRLRNIINKGISEEDFLEHVRNLFSLGWNRLKFYFMIGLPWETEADLMEILNLCLKVQKLAPKKKKLKISITISPFVPKAHTPFQWSAQNSLQELKEKICFLKKLFKPYKAFNLKFPEPKMSILEGIFSRGGRELSQVIEAAFQKGDILTSWTEFFNPERWWQAMQENGIQTKSYLSEKSPEQNLPWEHLNSGVNKSFLLRELNRAKKEKISPDCRYAACQKCGVCNSYKVTSSLSEQSENKSIAPILNKGTRDQTDLEDFNSLQIKNLDLGQKNVLLRIWHKKQGLAKYLSQLELMSFLERLLRRCSFPLSFSKGYHPKPIFSFGRALPVGIYSLAEWFCVYLREQIEVQDMLQKMNKQTVSGIEFYQIQELTLKHKVKSSILEEFQLTSKLPQKNTEPLWSKFFSTLKTESILVHKKKNNSIKIFDVFACFCAVEQITEHCIRIKFDWSQKYVNPLLIIESMLPELSRQDFELGKVNQSLPDNKGIIS